MSDTDQHTLDRQEQLDRLLALESEIARAKRGAATADRRSVELSAVATELDIASEPLIGLLQPVRLLHTIATWEGDSAAASRRRLDGHEERAVAALSAIDGLIADLRAEAGAAARLRNARQAGVDRMLPEFNALQAELGYYHGWFH